MIHLRSYESIKNLNRKLKNEKDPKKIQSIIDEINNNILNDENFDFIPYQIYTSNQDGVFCFIGDNGEKEFKNLCMLFNDNAKFSFITWNDWIKSLAKPLNINVIDYIINNNLVEKTILSFKKIHFSSKPTYKERKLVYEFRDKILNDEKFKIAQTTNKYNL